MLAGILSFSATLFGLAAAQSTPSVVCIAGQCLQGFTNVTIGAKLSAPGAPTELLLLPGQYTSTTDPQLLHTLLTSSSASLKPSPGFENATLSLPLNLQLSPGFSTYSDPAYAGQASFTALTNSSSSTNTSTPLTGKSLALSPSVRVTLTSGQNRLILWESVPDVSQLPNSASLSVSGIESSACNPSCSAAGVCSASGTCVCQPGFTGTSCEDCEAGRFGPTCQACPADCDKCEEGISGTGRCLSTSIPNAPATCNCVNGVCASDGSCTCNDGWTKGDDGKSCSKCDAGFFLTPTGDCKVCENGCSSCADGTGACNACKTGFTQDSTDRRKCNKAQSVTSTGTICPPNAFSINGGDCQPCSPSCQTCTGPTSNDCVVCATGQFLLNGSCVPTDVNGVCQGSKRIADNTKQQCDACGAKCTSCGIASFNTASTQDKLQCTGCIPGTFLSQGKCVDACPAGQFPDPKDNMTCISCDSSCSTCSGSANFCLTCPTGQLASNGKCVSACPSTSFPSTTSAGQCQQCHPDCATCSGGSAFNQCLTCPPERPVLSNGRCLPTCEKGQYLESTSGKCQSCDPSCSSCSGPGPSSCLACTSASQMLKGGSCVKADCGGATQVIPGLGVCFNQLVVVPTPSGTVTPSALPSITGIAAPVPVLVGKRSLEWWQILLMALGCAFIFLVFLLCWRRRARNRRAKRTAAFAQSKAITPQGMSRWRWRLVRLGERVFGHKKNNIQTRGDIELGFTEQDKKATQAHHEQDLNQLIESYQHPLREDWSTSSRAPTTKTKYTERSERPERIERTQYDHPFPPNGNLLNLHSEIETGNRLSSSSLYSQVTGIPRQGPEAKQPVRDQQFVSNKSQMASRFSLSSRGSSYYHGPENTAPPPPPLTDAQSYRNEILPSLRGEQRQQNVLPVSNEWLKSTHTGTSNTTTNSSNPHNPFLKLGQL